MKHLKLFFALFAMLALGVGNAWGAEQTVKWTATSGALGNGIGSGTIKTGTYAWNYTRTLISGASYTGWSSSCIQLGKNGGVENITFTTSAIPGTIKSVAVECSSYNNAHKVSIAVGGTTYLAATATAKWTTIGTKTGTGSSTGTINISFTGGTRALYIKSITVVYEETSGSTEPALTSIAISGDLEYKTYEEGDELDLTGLTVLANYESGDPKDVTKDVEWSYTPALTKGLTSVEVTATYEDKTATKTINGLAVNEHIVTPGAYDITLNNVFFGTTASANITGPVTGKQNDITITINGTGSTKKPRTDATYTRFYASSTMAISVPSGYVIKSIAITKNESDYAAPSVNVGTFNTSTKTWTGTANSVTMSFSAKSFINSIKVTYVADVKYALNITTPSNGTLVVKDGENTLTSGAEIYEGTNLTIIATPETGYEDGVVVVKNASDEDITATVYADGVLTMPAYAVTISATFEKKPCELLAKPTVSAETTYSSATLTWDAVANAAKYSVKIGTAEAVETEETSYEVTGLTAETEYTYQVQAIAEADQDTYCDSEVAEGTFTTATAPIAKLILKDIVGETTLTGSLNGTITLPTEAAECSKTFVGWDADENCNHAPTYAKGAEYTFTTVDPTLYAVYADGEGGGTVTITPSKGTEETKACTFNLDQDGYTLSASGGGSNPVYNETNSDARIYAGGILTLTATKAMNTIVIKLSAQGKKRLAPITASVGTIATQASGDATVTWTGNATEVAFTVGDKANFGSDGETKAGQLCFSTIEVTHSSEYSNYSTTCATAPIVTVTPETVTANATGAEGKVTVTYENVNTANVAVALFNDAACTEEFTAGWLTASIDADKNISYTVAENTTYAERKAYIKLTAPETTGATDPDVVVIPVTQAAKEKVFASLAELVAADLTAGDEVTVTLNNDVIKEFYIYSSKRCGVVFDVQKDGKDIKIYFNSQTTIDDWAVGGKLSGTLTNVKWTTYSSAWQLAPANTWAWANLTYTEPKAVSTVVVSGAPTKTTYVDGEAFDPAGLTVTVNYNDATTEVNPTGVTFTVTPATLVKGQTSVSVTATFNSVTSAAYEVTDLTVNDIPTKTVAEFIAAGGTRCYLEGIVSGLTEGNSMKYGNFDLTDASGTIYVYGCLNASGEKEKFAELGVKNGDKIKVIADEYELYGGTKDEAKNVQYVSHISAASITVENITMEVEEVATITATVDPADAVVTYTIKENEANAISLSGNTITALAEGTATITATVAEGATYLGNSVDFTVTVSPKAEKVVILAQLEGQWYAMTGAYVTDKTNVLAAIPVEYFNGTLYNVEEADKASIEWQRSMNGNKATFKNGNKYLTGGGGTSTGLTLKADAFEWDYNGVNYLCNDGKRTFLYCENTKNNVFGFKNFAISNAGSVKNNSDGTTESYSSFPTVTAPVYATGNPVYTRTVTNKYGTICLPYASASTSGAYFYEVVGKGTENGKPAVYLASVDALEAGVPYIFEKTANTITVTCQGEAIAEAGSANGLVGNFTNEFIVPADNYILYKNAFIPADGTTNKVNAYRAYLNMNDVTGGAPVQMPGRRYIGMSVQGENEATGFDNIQLPNANSQKLIINGQLIIIRDGIKYNAQGQKL